MNRMIVGQPPTFVPAATANEAHFEMAARHFRESAACVEGQVARIADLRALGIDTSRAEKVLAAMRTTFELHRQRLAVLLGERSNQGFGERSLRA